MKKIFIVAIAFLFFQCKSGLVTTSNACYNLINSSKAQNKAGDYNSALANFDEILKKCDSYDAKVPAYAGKAEALNGLRLYQQALDAAQSGLKLDKNSIDNLFEKSAAESGLGMNAEAKADLQAVIALTEKNRNTAQRATIYAKMAAIDSRQQMYPDALTNIKQAITLDPSNGDFYILQGDIYTASGNYVASMDSYDMAILKGKNDAGAWEAKIESIIKMNQAKYKTNDASTLASKMSASEKNNLCDAIRSGISKGMKNMQIEMTQVAVCK